MHAAFHGASWDGDVVACVVVGTAAGAGAGPAGRAARLTFFFRSESAEVISHVQSCESDLLGQLTGGLVVPLDFSEADEERGGAGEAEQERAGGGGYGSFLRGLSRAAEAAPAAAGGEEEGEEAEGGAAPDQYVLERAALAQWRALRAQRAA